MKEKGGVLSVERIKQLNTYVNRPEFKEQLQIPENEVVVLHPLAQGEYNINYWFSHPETKEKLVLRLNTGSQMHLEDQIGYEYKALKLLEHSGRTPVPICVDGSRQQLPWGILVMKFLEGRALDYRRDLHLAAEALADIHSVSVPEDTHLLSPGNPLKAILEECEEMVQTYYRSSLGEVAVKRQIEQLLQAGWAYLHRGGSENTYQCCINTELNAGNFLIRPEGKIPAYVIDWEKPLYGDIAQDLGHFLAPTTTFWKTDVILEKEEEEQFLNRYLQAADGRFDTSCLREKLDLYIPITCLRGVTWCAMAWVEYQNPDRPIRNRDTYQKISSYLTEEFLTKIRQRIGASN